MSITCRICLSCKNKTCMNYLSEHFDKPVKAKTSCEFAEVDFKKKYAAEECIHQKLCVLRLNAQQYGDEIFCHPECCKSYIPASKLRYD